jgi:hypothetical protein
MKALLCTLAALSIPATKALAWEPRTHVALAEIVLADALDDGKVSIYRLSPTTGAVLGKLGDYPVEPTLLAALRRNRAQYIAGVLGPDAYPDILTGQMCIHPGDDPRDADPVRFGNEPGEGADAWLTHLWTKSRASSPAVKAWVAGFLTHAAGDLYAHTIVNNFAGGEFQIGTNGIRHVVVEGYMGLRGPQPSSFNANIDGVSTFIYQNLVRVDPGSDLARLMVGPGAVKSLPNQFSKLRNRLQAQIDRYDRMTTLEKVAYDTTHPFEMGYIRAWRDDIDQGLRAWPQVSHNIALALFFNPTGMDTAGANEIANDYVNEHLLSMMGFPDLVGSVRALPDKLIDAFVPEDVREYFAALKESITSAMFQAVFGVTPDEIKAYFRNPETNFNPIVGPNSPHDPGAVTITLKDFNQNVLHLNDIGFTTPSERWTPDTFAPAYNTVTLTKMLFLSKDTVNQVMDDLRAPTITTIKLPDTSLTKLAPVQLTADNVMLGWDNSFDDDNQWHRNVGKLVFIRAGLYSRLFKAQIGENNDPPPAPPAPKKITVTIRRVKQIDDLDIDLFGAQGADFFARVTIDGSTTRTPTVLDDDDTSPSWITSVNSTTSIVTIRIKLYDEDGGLRLGDDHCDINPANSKFDLVMTYNLQTGAIGGDAVGTRGNEIHVVGAGNDDKAEIWFTINHS